MKFKIHRGANEIGGSCLEVWTDSARIVIDFGLPLVNSDNTPFDARTMVGAKVSDLIEQGILPDIEALYNGTPNTALLISHAHQDHYGLIRYIHDSCPVFMGRPTHKLIEITNTFTRQQYKISNSQYFVSGQSFDFGDINITPYLMDHAAFDAYAFLVKSNGKSIFYSGDFRIHGRKAKVFEWFKLNVSANVDYLFMEGTTIGRIDHSFPTENELENEFVRQFKNSDRIHLIYVSGQNIDRLVSIYRACKRAGKIFAIDFYVATVLKEMARFNQIPHPSSSFPEIKVFFPYRLSQMIAKQGDHELLYQFKNHKITKQEIDKSSNRIVMTTRPSMKSDLDFIKSLEGGTFIYSMWSGYRKNKETAQFIDFLTDKGMMEVSIHTSGHADLDGLKEMVTALNPKHLVPFHTFEGDQYQDIFNDRSVKRVEDGVTITV